MGWKFMSTGTTSIDGVTASARSPLMGWLAVFSVTMGIFSIVTTEILPIGLLTPIGSSFTISGGTAGLMMTVPGYLAAVAAPTATVATARVDRRLMLCTFMALLAIANLLAAVAPNYWVMLISRVVVGIVIGGFWSIGAGLAERLVPPESVGRATAVIFSAVPLGSVALPRLSWWRWRGFISHDAFPGQRSSESRQRRRTHMCGIVGWVSYERDLTVPDPAGGCPRVTRSRSWVGVSANTSRAVSSNARMLANPAADVTVLIGSGVVSMSSRAVWAISRMARATTSARWFHSGEPGPASGRHRLQARNPACCAAAALG